MYITTIVGDYKNKYIIRNKDSPDYYCLSVRSSPSKSEHNIIHRDIFVTKEFYNEI